MRYASAGFALIIGTVLGCQGDSSSPEPTPEPWEAKLGTTEAIGVSGRHRAQPESEWVPAEWKTGMKNFKDSGVYVDGKVVGMLRFGELPVPMPVDWHEEEGMVEFKAGEPVPEAPIVRQRRYQLVDYFEAVGIDVGAIKEVHLYGGNRRKAAVIISGREFRKHRGIQFRFGSEVWGKPLPACALGIGDGKCPDNLGAVVVYIDKKPPTREGNQFYLNGKRVTGIPYYGEPLRGGVRVYKDNVYAASIKRRLLHGDELRVLDEHGVPQWKFFAFLEAQGVDTSTVQEAWIVQRNERVRRLTRTEIENATFIAEPQKSGQILFGNERIRANAIMLHSTPVKQEDLPKILPHERYDS